MPDEENIHSISIFNFIGSCHVTYIELVHGHGHDLGGVSPQPQLPSLLLVPGDIKHYIDIKLIENIN